MADTSSFIVLHFVASGKMNFRGKQFLWFKNIGGHNSCRNTSQNDFIHNTSRSTFQQQILKSYVQFILHMYIFELYVFRLSLSGGGYQ